MKAIDLFCGCGGISAGLRMLKFEILAGIDIEKKYISTFVQNFGEDKAFNIDITSITPNEVMDSVQIDKRELDLLAGGPPCQGFSKCVPRKYRYSGDPNNLLIQKFVQYCLTIKPRMILMENVAEMKNGFGQSYTDEIIIRLTEGGYTVSSIVLNAADYGIPQRRRRAFFLANREGIKFHAPVATNVAKNKNGNPQFSFLSSLHHVNVWDAIGDLPGLKHGEGYEESDYACEPFSDYQALMRNGQIKVKNHVSRFLQPKQLERLSSIQPGQGLKDLPDRLKVKGGYSGVYGRLTKDMVAPTITRWVFHPGSGRWGHPVDIRILSIREVARIQGFPDSFEFTGTYTDQAGQLGNAVPPLLVKKIVSSMVDQLDASNSDSKSTKTPKDILSPTEGNSKETMCVS